MMLTRQLQHIGRLAVSGGVMTPVKRYSRLNSIYDSIPDAIDREIEKVLAKYDAPQIEPKKDPLEWGRDNISSDWIWSKNIARPKTADDLRLWHARQAQNVWARRDWERRCGIQGAMAGAASIFENCAAISSQDVGIYLD